VRFIQPRLQILELFVKVVEKNAKLEGK